jgi:zinc transporter, ZIP family
MAETLAFAAVASAGLILGSCVGAYWDAPAGFIAAALAFAAGSLTAALAFELFAEEKHDNLLVASAGLVTGGAVFIFIDAAVERRWQREKATGFALLAVVTLDGVPENLALGVTLAAEGSVALLAAIFFSNLAESLGGAADMRRGGDPPRRAILLWLATGVLLALAIVVGRMLGTTGGAQSFLLAFAGGAVLASLVDTVMPEAYREGGPFVAFATIGGFLLAFLLATND